MNGNIAAFMVVKNDQFYIDMALKSVLPFVNGVYIQDQMSTDGTAETVAELNNQKVVIEQVDTGQQERFEPEYNEPYWRTEAVKRAESVFNPEWILKLDADEIYTEHFFKSLERLLPDFDGIIDGVKVGGDRFISMTHRSIYPPGMERSPAGMLYPDPHLQLWRANKGYYYVSNPNLSGYFHPLLNPHPRNVYWLEGICNIHIHRIFGPKAFKFWAEGGDMFEKKTPFHPPTMAPKWYWSEKNMGNSEQAEFEWPEYILSKWREWGIW